MEKRIAKNIAGTTLVLVLLMASALLLVADIEDQFSDWSAPANLGPPVNTVFAEIAPSISKDGLSLYFFSERPGSLGLNDIWVTRRASVDDPWLPPQVLGPAINTEHNENAPTLSLDGHRLYFASDRPGGFGGLDLYVSRRHNKRDDFGWQPAVKLGSGVNTSFNDAAPALFEDDGTGTITLYFHSDRVGGIGADDIYASTLNPDETFGPAVLVEELSSLSRDRLPSIRRDGLEMFLGSNRPGTLGFLDIWVSTRANTSDPWSTPVNLGSVINSAAGDARAVLSFDGTALYFHSTRTGDFDLYVSTRSKLRGRGPDKGNE
jgi:hypothetical protein